MVCTTQNGHVLVWKVGGVSSSSGNTKEVCGKGQGMLERVCTGQLHLGSIEGLAWQNQLDSGSLATVGADCVVNLFRLVGLYTGIHLQS